MGKSRFSGMDENWEPLCQFGPGGDYTRSWPRPEVRKKAGGEKVLGRLLETIADIIGATVNPELMEELRGQYEVELLEEIKIVKEELKGEGKHEQTDNAKTTKSSGAGVATGAGKLLFADDSGSSKRVRRKPHYRLRTYRRAAKKRTGREYDGQGTLFEVNSASQSAA